MVDSERALSTTEYPDQFHQHQQDVCFYKDLLQLCWIRSSTAARMHQELLAEI